MAISLKDVDFESSDEDNVVYKFWTGARLVNITIHLGYFIKVTSTGKTPLYSIVNLMPNRDILENALFLAYLMSGDYLEGIADRMCKNVLISKLEPINNLPC